MKTSEILARIRDIILFVTLTTVLFSCCGCTEEYDTYVTIINNSSYDLNVVFQQFAPFDVNKGDSLTFTIFPGRGAVEGFRDPNELPINILISDLATGEVIKEIDNINTEKILFEFVEIKSFTAMYNFEITDDLLFP